jgi:insertion element IS1 protein InsB
VDCVRNRTIGWIIGNRNAKTFRKFYEKLKLPEDVVIYTDDWDVYSKIIPKQNHIIGKQHTIGIEQNNSNIRHYSARMTRKTKVVSKSEEMIDLTLRIMWHLNEGNFYEYFQKIALSIY